MPRMTIEFPDKVNKLLEELSAKDQISKAEVIRRALALYSYAHTEAVDKHNKLSITDDQDQVIKDIIFN